MTPELEKVARAIACVGYGIDYTPEISINEAHIAMARAALDAIREPSEGMIEVAAELEDDASHYWEDSWTGVIDHILGKEPTP